jgi:hypothetical protein
VVLEVGSKHLRPVIPQSTPKPLQELISSCWAENPAQRPSFQDIVNTLISMKVHSLYSEDAHVVSAEDDSQGDHQPPRPAEADVRSKAVEEGMDEAPVRPVMLYSPSVELRAPRALSSSRSEEDGA